MSFPCGDVAPEAAAKDRQLTRNLPRRLERLETRAAVLSKDKSISVRIHFIHPEKGLTEIMILESGKPNTIVKPTPEEEAAVRESLMRRRTRTGTATDMSS